MDIGKNWIIIDRITCTTSTVATARPITSHTQSPMYATKRKSNSEEEECPYKFKSKKQKESDESVNYDFTSIYKPSSPLYKNFGNGLTLCNNTKTNIFRNIDDVLLYIMQTNEPINLDEKNDIICDKNMGLDIFKELIDELHHIKELPDLAFDLWGLCNS